MRRPTVADMTDVDESSGGTFCVPGAHRDTRNPRGPTDGITVTAPIPGDQHFIGPLTAKLRVFASDCLTISGCLWAGVALCPAA